MNIQFFNSYLYHVKTIVPVMLLLIICVQDVFAQNEHLTPENIRIRDPFILADTLTKTYYLYASKTNRNENATNSVEVYTSKDLQHWEAPQTVFAVDTSFWAQKHVWAPEVHLYKGKYYLFVTLTSDDSLANAIKPAGQKWPTLYKRGTQIFVADNPTGAFRAFANTPHTPDDWMALDGTLWVEKGIPYMVFCHEWVQIADGTMELVRLKKDLSDVKGSSITLFKASQASWVKPRFDGRANITDGCYLYTTKTGKLLMIWSSVGEGGYAVGIAESITGSVKGPWRHQPQRLFEADGGHGMIFKTFEGQLVIALHQPNTHFLERMKLYKLIDTGHSLELGEIITARLESD